MGCGASTPAVTSPIPPAPAPTRVEQVATGDAEVSAEAEQRAALAGGPPGALAALSKYDNATAPPVPPRAFRDMTAPAPAGADAHDAEIDDLIASETAAEPAVLATYAAGPEPGAEAGDAHTHAPEQGGARAASPDADFDVDAMLRETDESVERLLGLEAPEAEAQQQQQVWSSQARAHANARTRARAYMHANARKRSPFPNQHTHAHAHTRTRAHALLYTSTHARLQAGGPSHAHLPPPTNSRDAAFHSILGAYGGAAAVNDGGGDHYEHRYRGTDGSLAALAHRPVFAAPGDDDDDLDELDLASPQAQVSPPQPPPRAHTHAPHGGGDAGVGFGFVGGGGVAQSGSADLGLGMGFGGAGGLPPIKPKSSGMWDLDADDLAYEEVGGASEVVSF